MLVVRGYGHAGRFGVGVEIGRGREIRIDADDLVERFAQWKREESDARIEIERDVAFRTRGHRAKKIFNKEAIRLEKREVADAEFESTGFMHQIAGASEFESI